jgi:hypothetical protein
VANCRLFVGDV